MPVYRTPIHLLYRLLTSALEQTLQDIELILVDDASPDDCPKVLDAAAEKDKRVTVLHRVRNERAGMARNDGLRIAKGKYVLFVDSDDFMHSKMCSKMLELALQHQADIISCSWDIFDAENRPIGRHRLPDCVCDLSSPHQKVKAFRHLNSALWNKMFLRDKVKKINFERFEVNIGEDILFNISALCRSQRMVMTSYVGYGYTAHNTSVTGRSTKGISYLRTLSLSQEKITDVLLRQDGSKVARIYAERSALNRFIGGCQWIAEHPSSNERSAMWDYWHHYLRYSLLPSIRYCKILSISFWLIALTGNLKSVYPLMRFVSKISDPLRYIDRISA
ncbi:MAG: glycosyltransferase [Deltaproteobacteria bacterium]|nr:glycosyltransferase [Deltaproteobacteria bacterium]